MNSTATIVRYIRSFSVKQRSANHLVANESSRISSRVAVTHIYCIIARVFAVNIGKIRRILFKNQIKGHIYCLFNPSPPCFLASKCLNLIGRAETALSNHTSFNKNSVFINRKHVYSK